MKLSQLVFQCLKYGTYQTDTNFTYSAFINKDYDNDSEYKDAIDKVWFPLNEALHRLSVKGKIPNKIAELKVENNVAVFNDEELETKIKFRNIRNVFQLHSTGETKIGHRRVGNMLILYGFNGSKPVFAEYKVDIPNFDKTMMEFDDKDLNEEYGISETACSFIIEYVMSGLLEETAPEMAYQHRTIGEQYFADLDTYNNGFEQLNVQPVDKIGE